MSNEKYKGVRLEAEGSTIKIIAHNPQHEEAVEEIEAEFNFDRLAVGFNVTYLLDALMAIDTEHSFDWNLKMQIAVAWFPHRTLMLIDMWLCHLSSDPDI